jgi:hypothetical protein
MAFHIQWRSRMTNHHFLSAALISAVLIATPAVARTSHVISRHHAQDGNASPSANHFHGRVDISTPYVSAFPPAPPSGENCDVGDNPRVC